jgi:hypothetical protein
MLCLTRRVRLCWLRRHLPRFCLVRRVRLCWLRRAQVCHPRQARLCDPRPARSCWPHRHPAVDPARSRLRSRLPLPPLLQALIAVQQTTSRLSQTTGHNTNSDAALQRYRSPDQAPTSEIRQSGHRSMSAFRAAPPTHSRFRRALAPIRYAQAPLSPSLIPRLAPALAVTDSRIR